MDQHLDTANLETPHLASMAATQQKNDWLDALLVGDQGRYHVQEHMVSMGGLETLVRHSNIDGLERFGKKTFHLSNQHIKDGGGEGVGASTCGVGSVYWFCIKYPMFDHSACKDALVWVDLAIALHCVVEMDVRCVSREQFDVVVLELADFEMMC